MNWTTYNSAGAALSQSLTDMPVGTITGYAGATAPSGWLLCDGAAVSRTDYAELFGVVGTTYGSGNGSTTFNVPDSSGFIILATSQAARLAAAALPQYVTSLPSSPVDGQTVVYAADATNGVMWTLRYRAASSSSYKWEFVGGPPLSSQVDSLEYTTSGSYTALTTAGPSITLPLAGDYDIKIGAYIQHPMTQSTYWMSYDIGATGAVDNDGIRRDQYNADTPRSTANNYRTRRKTGLSAVTLTAKYKSGGGANCGWGDRTMIVTPVRVG